MCKLQFDYSGAPGASNDLKESFEAFANKRFKFVCESLNKENGIIMVSWKGEKLRGVVAVSEQIAGELRRNDLPGEFDFTIIEGVL